jgi:hypothetical protein
MLVQTSDLIPAQNPGATYFAEAQYIVPHEGTWCQSHPDQCNMYNNASYQQQSVSGGPTNFNFSAIGSTVREQPAIMAWTGATIGQVEPDPGNDGIFFVGYKVTGPVGGVWHYEYAIYNQNLDRGIQSVKVVFPLFPPILSNIGFHAPPQHPGFAHDGTQGDAGYSSTPWTVDQSGGLAITWSTETFAQNQNANAIRFGTLYNFRFDSTGPPANSTANIGFFKTGARFRSNPGSLHDRLHSHTDAYTNTKCYADSYPYSNANYYPYANRYLDTDADSYSDANFNSATNSHAQTKSNNQRTPNAASAAVRALIADS